MASPCHWAPNLDWSFHILPWCILRQQSRMVCIGYQITGRISSSNHHNSLTERLPILIGEHPLALTKASGTAIQFKYHGFQIWKCLCFLCKSCILFHSGECCYSYSTLHNTKFTAAESMGGRWRGEPPPTPVSSQSHHQSSRYRDHGLPSSSPDKS